MVLIKGDYANATTSAVAALPLLGSLIGSGIKWGAKGVANAEKIADGIKAGSRIIGNAGALIQSGGQTLESVGNLYDSYVKDGEIISWKNATDLITLGLSVAGMGMAGKSLAKDGKALKAVSQGNVNVKPAAVSNSSGKVATGSDSGNGLLMRYDLQMFARKSASASKFKWGNPKSTPTYGHTFSIHGKKLTTQQLIDRANGFDNPHQVGQWLDEQQAADFLADVVKNREGAFDVQLPSDIKARSILPNGTEVIPDMVKIVMKPDGSIKTAYPYSSLYPNS